MYYRVSCPQPLPKSYGFKRVTKQELDEIMDRVRKPTYNTKLQCCESEMKNNNNRSSVYRCTSPSCAKMRTGSDADDGRKSRRLEPMEIDRLFRRLRRPTFSSRVYRSKGRNEDELIRIRKFTRSRTQEEQSRAQVNVRRPTSATLSKIVGVCHICDEDGTKKETDVFEYDYGDYRKVSPKEVQAITERVRSATMASRGSDEICRKYQSSTSMSMSQRKELPLISGLARSRNVDEINIRLYSGKGFRMTPQATYTVGGC